MERSSRVLQHGNPINWNFFPKKFEIEFCPYPDFPYAEKRNRPGFVDISPTLVIDASTERYSRVLQHGNQKFDFYASPTSGEAYRNRRLTTNFELWVEIFCVPTCFHMRIPKPCLSVRLSVRLFVCLSICLSVCPHPEKRYHHSFVNISPTLVIDTSMERSSRVLHYGNPKNWFLFFKKVRNSNFDFCRRAEITLASSISVLH